MTTYLKADAFYYAQETRGAGYLEIQDGKFSDWLSQAPAGAQVLDYTGYQIAPGLVDTHIHGFAGHDVMDNSAEGMLAMSQALPSMGVTSYLPTTLTSSFEHLRDVSATVASVVDTTDGAKIHTR